MAKILVVDDEPDFRLILSDVLTRAGHEVTEATNGAEALKRVPEVKPSLVVIDWNMPQMTGPEFCRAIRQDPQYSNLPIIMLTVRQQDLDLAEGLHQGCDLYLTKPIKPEEFLLRVKAILNRFSR